MKNKGRNKNPFKAELKNQTEESVDLFLYGEIVGSQWDEWSSEDMAPETFRQLLDEANGRNLNVFINSGGGSVFGGLAIYNSLKRYSGKVNTFVDGLAGSISSIIAFGGRLHMPGNAMLMIHKPWIVTMGSAPELRKTANTLDRIETSLLSVYEENILAGVEMSTIKTMVAQETWLSGTEASKIFDIELLDSIEAVATVKGDYFNRYENAPSTILDAETTLEDDLDTSVTNESQTNENEPTNPDLDDENLNQIDNQPSDPTNPIEPSEEEKLDEEISNMLVEIELL